MYTNFNFIIQSKDFKETEIMRRWVYSPPLQDLQL